MVLLIGYRVIMYKWLSNKSLDQHILSYGDASILSIYLRKYIHRDCIILILPCTFQRLCKYPLLLDSLLKYTLPDHPDIADLRLANAKMKVRICIMYLILYSC